MIEISARIPPRISDFDDAIKSQLLQPLEHMLSEHSPSPKTDIKNTESIALNCTSKSTTHDENRKPQFCLTIEVESQRSLPTLISTFLDQMTKQLIQFFSSSLSAFSWKETIWNIKLVHLDLRDWETLAKWINQTFHHRNNKKRKQQQQQQNDDMKENINANVNKDVIDSRNCLVNSPSPMVSSLTFVGCQLNRKATDILAKIISDNKNDEERKNNKDEDFEKRHKSASNTVSANALLSSNQLLNTLCCINSHFHKPQYLLKTLKSNTNLSKFHICLVHPRHLSTCRSGPVMTSMLQDFGYFLFCNPSLKCAHWQSLECCPQILSEQHILELVHEISTARQEGEQEETEEEEDKHEANNERESGINHEDTTNNVNAPTTEEEPNKRLSSPTTTAVTITTTTRDDQEKTDEAIKATAQDPLAFGFKITTCLQSFTWIIQNHALSRPLCLLLGLVLRHSPQLQELHLQATWSNNPIEYDFMVDLIAGQRLEVNQEQGRDEIENNVGRLKSLTLHGIHVHPSTLIQFVNHNHHVKTKSLCNDSTCTGPEIDTNKVDVDGDSLSGLKHLSLWGMESIDLIKQCLGQVEISYLDSFHVSVPDHESLQLLADMMKRNNGSGDGPRQLKISILLAKQQQEQQETKDDTAEIIMQNENQRHEKEDAALVALVQSLVGNKRIQVLDLDLLVRTREMYGFVAGELVTGGMPLLKSFHLEAPQQEQEACRDILKQHVMMNPRIVRASCGENNGDAINDDALGMLLQQRA